MENEWEKSVLKELIDIKHGYAFKSVNFSDEETKKILLTPGNFKIGGGFSENKFKYYKEGAEIPDEFILNTGDLIVTMTDLSKNGDTLGYPAIVPSIRNKILLHNQRLGKIIVKEVKLINTKFLYYLFCTEQYRQEVLATSTGTTVKHTAPKRILSFEFLLPPFKEQKSIANILSLLDNKILLNNQMNFTLEQIAQTLFKHWFIDFEFPDENGNLYKSSGGRMVDSELGEIPEGWKPSSVGAEFDITMGQSPPGDTYNENKEGELFFQGRRDFGWRYPENRIYCTQPNRMAKKGDTLLSVRAPVGDINKATSDCCIGRGLAALRHKSGCEAYTYYSLMELSRNFRNFNSEGTVFGSINQKDLKALKILKPSSSIVELFTNVAGVIDQQILSFDIQNRTLSQLRDSLLPKLMSGKIRVEC